MCVNAPHGVMFICNFRMDLKLEQRASIKFYVKLSTEMLNQAYSNEAPRQVKCFEWHSLFKSDQTSMEYDKRSEWPSTSTTLENVKDIRQIIYHCQCVIWISSGNPCIQQDGRPFFLYYTGIIIISHPSYWLTFPLCDFLKIKFKLKVATLTPWRKSSICYLTCLTEWNIQRML